MGGSKPKKLMVKGTKEQAGTVVEINKVINKQAEGKQIERGRQS